MIEFPRRVCGMATVWLVLTFALTGCGGGSDGDSTTATIGAAGGTVSGPDGV